MGRLTATRGSVEFTRGAWRAVVTFPKGPARPKRQRQWWWLDARNEAEARAQAVRLDAAAKAGRIEPHEGPGAPAKPPKPRPWDTIPGKPHDGLETV